MQEIYVAINGDDVGNSIGSAIASDDRESLGSTTSTLKDIHSQIDQWVEQCGGEVVTSSGDEGIYKVPHECADHLEDIRSEYQEHTGHTLTIGVGQSMSEAAKALIYGKMNNKDQIVEYAPEMDEAISSETGEMGTQGYEQQNEGKLPAEEEMSYQKENAAQQEASMAEEPDEDMVEEDGEGEADKDAEEIIEEASNDPEHEKDMTPEEEREHDAAENELDEMDDDIVEADEEANMEGIDGEAGEEDMQVDEDENMEEEPEADEGDHEDLLAEMVHAHMSGEEDEEMPEEEMMEEEVPEEMPEEEMMEEDQYSDEEIENLRADIAHSLNSFKANREMILQMQQASPEMYESLMVMLRSMIAMGRHMGFDAEQAADEQMSEAQAQEEMPEAAPEGQPMAMSEKK